MPVDAPDDPERDLEVGDTLERSKSGFCRAEAKLGVSGSHRLEGSVSPI